MNRILIGFAVLSVFCAGAYCERAANACKSTRLTTASVLVSCNDEREPHVSKIDATATAIVITCKQ